nr:similar to phage-related minor tail protein [uncultured bacterium]
MAEATVIRLRVDGESEVRRAFTGIGEAGQRTFDHLAAGARQADEKLKAIGQAANDGATKVKSFGAGASGSLAEVAEQASAAALTISGIAAALGRPEMAAGAAAIAVGLNSIAESSRGLAESLTGTTSATEDSSTSWVAWTAGITAAAVAAGIVYVSYRAVTATLRELDDLLTGNRLALSSGETAAFAGRLNDLSVKTGLSTTALRALVGIQKELGVSETQAADIARHMASALGDHSVAAKTARDAIRGLGIDLDRVAAADYPKVFDQVVAALNRFRDGPGKSAAAKAIFGTDDLAVLKQMREAGPIWTDSTARANAYADATVRLIAANTNDIAAIRNRKSWLEELIASFDAATSRSEEFRNAQAYAALEASGAARKYFAEHPWFPSFSDALAATKESAKGLVDYMQVIGHGIAPDLIAALEVPVFVDTRPAMPASPEMVRAADKLEATFDPRLAALQTYQTEMASLDELYRAGALSLERYIALSVKVGEAMTGDTEKVRQQTVAMRDLAAAALHGPAAVAQQTAINATREAVLSGVPEPLAQEREQDKLAAQQDQRRNAAIFALNQEAQAYRALAEAKAAGTTGQAERQNAVAAEQAAGGARNIDAWTQAWEQAQAAKKAYADTSAVRVDETAKQKEWLDGITREIAASDLLSESYRTGSQEAIDAARVQVEVAAKAEAAHKSIGIATEAATAALLRLNAAKRESTKAEWVVGIDRDVTANTTLAEAIRTGNVDVIRRSALAKEAAAAHDKFGVSIEEATHQLDRQHAVLAAPEIAKHLADMKAEAELQERVFRAARANDPAAARAATVKSEADRFSRANPYASEADKKDAAQTIGRNSVNAQRQAALGSHLGLDPGARRAAAQAELDDLANVTDAEGNLILTREDAARRQSRIDQDYRRGQIENLMATRTFAGGAEAAMRDYLETTGDQARQGFGVVSHGLKSLEDGLVDFVSGTKSAKEAFTDMVSSILNELTRMSIQKAITNPLSQMLGLSDGGGSGGGLFGAIFGNNSGSGWMSDLFGSFSLFHDGGVVGQPTSAAMTAPFSLFASAPRYHSGGVAGAPWLGPDEVPIIAKKGEVVIPQDKLRPGSSDRPVTVVMNITTPDANSFRQSQGQMAAEMARAVTRGRRNL